MKPFECAVEGCESRPVGRGLCNKHYLRLSRSGDMGPWQRKKKESVCSTEGCGQKHQADGLCKKHSYRDRKSRGMCTMCGIRAASGIYCTTCNERSLWVRKLRRMGKSIKTVNKKLEGKH